MITLDASIFKVKGFKLYLSTRFLMTFAIQMQNVITGWYLYNLTKDPLTLGIVGLAEALPAISFALYAGHLVDKYDKRKVLTGAFVVYGLCTALFAFFTGGWTHDHFTTHQIVWLFYSVLFVLGLARAFAGPASFSVIGYLFPRSMMAKVSPISSTSWQLGAILGPALGGILYGATSASFSSTVVTFLIIVSVICSYFLPSMPAISEDAPGGYSIASRIKEGISYVFKNKIILSAISLDLFAVLFGGAVALLPVFASEILHVGSTELGWMRAAPSAGAAIVLLLLSVRPPEHRTGIKLLLAVAGFGLCILGFANSTHLWLSIALLFGSGAFDAVSVVIRGTLLQIYTPDRMKGRVAAVNTMFIGSSNEIGAFESGTAARIIGTVPSVIFGAGMTILIVIVTAFLAPQLRKVELKDIDTETIDGT